MRREPRDTEAVSPPVGDAGGGRRALARTTGALALAMLCLAAAPAFSKGRSEKVATSDGDEVPPVAAPLDWDTAAVGDEVTARGVLGVYGNEPHTFLAVSVETDTTQSGSRLVRVAGDLQDILFAHQGELVSVTGTILQLETGPGFPLVLEVTEYQLGAEP